MRKVKEIKINEHTRNSYEWGNDLKIFYCVCVEKWRDLCLQFSTDEPKEYSLPDKQFAFA